MKKTMMKKAMMIGLVTTISCASLSVRADAGYGIQSNVLPPNTTSGSQPSSGDTANGNNNPQAVLNALVQKAQTQLGVPSSSGGPAAANVAPSIAAGTTTTPPVSGTSAVPNTGLDDQAFADTVRNMMPLSPQQIKVLRYLFDQSQRAAATYPGTPPKPTSTSVLVNLSPGSMPPVIRLSAGFISSLVFIDSTGASWPITAYDLGDPQSFNIQWDKKGNTLLVQALSSYKSANLAVMLQGLDTPVMLTLLPGQDAVDYRMDLRIPGLGPNANPVLAGLPATASPELLNVLNGVPPNGSRTLKITGGPCQGWLLNGHLYLRTPLTVVSPAWLATMGSPDGTNAYELQSTPVILASQRGQIIKLTVEGL